MGNNYVHGIISFIGEKSKSGYFIFHITTTKPKITELEKVKEIVIPFQGNSKSYFLVSKIAKNNIVKVFFEITTKVANRGEIIYVNLLATKIEDVANYPNLGINVKN